MNGLEAVEIRFSEIDLGDRYDAEYFSKEDLSIKHLLENRQHSKLKNLGNFVASAFYPAATQLYEFGDEPFIRCVDCINYPFITKQQDSLFEKIPIDFAINQKGIANLKQGDIVITKVGTPCFSSIIEEYEHVALSRTVLGLKNIKNINRYYLLTFLRSKYGFNQLMRQRELTIQFQLTLERVKDVNVYIPNLIFQNEIEKIIRRQSEINKQYQTLYSLAEELLLNELGLHNWEPTEANTEVKTFKNSFLESGRLDAEYYQPKYDEVIEKIQQTEYYTLAE